MAEGVWGGGVAGDPLKHLVTSEKSAPARSRLTHLDRGVLGIPSDRLAIPVAYWVGIGVAHSV